MPFQNVLNIDSDSKKIDMKKTIKNFPQKNINKMAHRGPSFEQEYKTKKEQMMYVSEVENLEKNFLVRQNKQL